MTDQIGNHPYDCTCSRCNDLVQERPARTCPNCGAFGVKRGRLEDQIIALRAQLAGVVEQCAKEADKSENHIGDAIAARIRALDLPAAPKAEPVLDKPAQIGATRFGVGIQWSVVIDRAQREWDYFHGLQNPRSSDIDASPQPDAARERQPGEDDEEIAI